MSLFALDEVKCRVTELMALSLFVGVAAERVMRVPTRALFRAAIRSMSAQRATKSFFERPRIFTSRSPATTCCSPLSSEARPLFVSERLCLMCVPRQGSSNGDKGELMCNIGFSRCGGVEIF